MDFLSMNWEQNHQISVAMASSLDKTASVYQKQKQERAGPPGGFFVSHGIHPRFDLFSPYYSIPCAGMQEAGSAAYFSLISCAGDGSVV